jgi:hypothetical protein
LFFFAFFLDRAALLVLVPVAHANPPKNVGGEGFQHISVRQERVQSIPSLSLSRLCVGSDENTRRTLLLLLLSEKNSKFSSFSRLKKVLFFFESSSKRSAACSGFSVRLHSGADHTWLVGAAVALRVFAAGWHAAHDPACPPFSQFRVACHL